MKITIIEPEDGEEDEIIIRCRHLDKRLMKHIEAGILNCNSVLPYVRLTNEWLVRDTSKKIRAVKQLKGMSVKAPRGGVGVKSN